MLIEMLRSLLCTLCIASISEVPLSAAVKASYRGKAILPAEIGAQAPDAANGVDGVEPAIQDPALTSPDEPVALAEPAANPVVADVPLKGAEGQGAREERGTLEGLTSITVGLDRSGDAALRRLDGARGPMTGDAEVSEIRSDASMESPAAANDRPLYPDKAFLRRSELQGSRKLGASDGQLIFDAKNEEIYEQFGPELTRLAQASDSEGFKRLNELEKLALQTRPAVRVSANATIVEWHPMQSTLRITENPTAGARHRELKIPVSNWLGYLGEVSHSGKYVIFTTLGATHIRVLSLETGKIVLDRQADPGAEFFGIGAHFSANGDIITVERVGFTEILRLKPDGVELIGAYELGDHTFDIGEQTQLVPSTGKITLEEIEALQEGLKFKIPIPRDGLGEIRYLPKQKALLAFYLGPEPLILKLGKNGAFSRGFFSPAKTEFTPSKQVDENKDIERLLDELEKPRYSGRGLVSSDEKLLFAIRTQGRGDSFLSLIDLYSIETRELLRTIPFHNTIAMMALSPNKRFLAVSSNRSEGVRVFDLKDNSSTPLAAIDFQNKEGELLSFESDTTLLAGSFNGGILYRFKLPAPRTYRRLLSSQP